MERVIKVILTLALLSKIVESMMQDFGKNWKQSIGISKSLMTLAQTNSENRFQEALTKNNNPHEQFDTLENVISQNTYNGVAVLRLEEKKSFLAAFEKTSVYWNPTYESLMMSSEYQILFAKETRMFEKMHNLNSEVSSLDLYLRALTLEEKHATIPFISSRFTDPTKYTVLATSLTIFTKFIKKFSEKLETIKNSILTILLKNNIEGFLEKSKVMSFEELEIINDKIAKIYTELKDSLKSIRNNFKSENRR